MTTPLPGPRWAVSIPQVARDGEFDPFAVRTYLQRVEALGFDGAWTAEQSLGTMPLLGPIELLGFAAACTERLRLGCAVFVLPQHQPVQLAKSISSLDQMTGGRIQVGLGIGGRFRMLSAFGAGPDGLVTRFDEGLALMRACWTQERIDVDGRFWQVRGGAMEPKPVQRPGPPVWLGGGHPDALRRAVRSADGFFGAGSTTTTQFAEQVTVVREALAASDRDPAGFGIAKRVYLAVDDDADRARRTVTDGLAGLYGWFGLPDLTPVAVHGTPADVARGLADVVAAGADLVLLHPMADEAEQVERLAAEVLPQVA